MGLHGIRLSEANLKSHIMYGFMAHHSGSDTYRNGKEAVIGRGDVGAVHVFFHKGDRRENCMVTEQFHIFSLRIIYLVS